MQPNKTVIDAGTRIGSMLLDHFFMTIIGMLFFIPAMVAGFSGVFTTSHEQQDVTFFEGPWKYIAIFGFCLYFCKDVFNGRSIAKRILRLQVVDNNTGLAATPLQTFIRNIFCVFWMIEGIVALVNTSRRIGDRVAGTRLVYYDATAEKPKPSLIAIALPPVISFGLTAAFAQILPTPGSGKVNYSPASYNQPESKRLEQVITDSLGKFMTADIKLYDSVANEKIKYLSVIIQLKDNYLEEDSEYEYLHGKTCELIYSIIPKEEFTGQIKYIYKAPGQFRSRSTNIGTAPASRK